MELIVITRPDYFPGEGELINALFGAGLRLLHLRKPENDVAKFRALMNEINPLYYQDISIHQHHELADEFSIMRLHFPEKLWSCTTGQRKIELFTIGFRLSRSVHQWEVPADTAFLDYVFFGPVFNSISKPGYLSTIPKDFYLSGVPGGLKIFAIGGITAHRLGDLKRMNFHGAVILGSIWNHPPSALKEFEKCSKSV